MPFLEGRRFHRCKRFARARTRCAEEGLTATTSWSNIVPAAFEKFKGGSPKNEFDREKCVRGSHSLFSGANPLFCGPGKFRRGPQKSVSGLEECESGPKESESGPKECWFVRAEISSVRPQTS